MIPTETTRDGGDTFITNIPGLYEPSILTKRELFLTGFMNLSIIVFVILLVGAWLNEGRGWPSTWMLLALLGGFGLYLLARWSVFLVIAEMRTRSEREYLRWVRLQESRDTEAVQSTPYRVQQAQNDGIHINRGFDRTINQDNLSAAGEARRDDHGQRDKDRESADRNAELDRTFQLAMHAVQTERLVTVELAQQMTEFVMALRDAEMSGANSQIANLINSMADLKPALEALMNADNPQAQQTIFKIYEEVIRQGFTALARDLAVQQRRSSRRADVNA